MFFFCFIHDWHNWIICLELLKEWCYNIGSIKKKLKFKFDTVIFMVLYQNILRLIIEWPSRWWQWLEVFNNRHSKWAVISRADRFMVIYASLLAGESWNNLLMPLKMFSISHPVVLTLDWKAPWMTWSPPEPCSNNWGTSLRLQMFFNFSCTDQFVFGPSLESIDRLFVERFVVAFKSSSMMLSAFSQNILLLLHLLCHPKTE